MSDVTGDWVAEVTGEDGDEQPSEQPRRRGVGKGVASLIVFVLVLGVCYAALSLLAPAPSVAGAPHSDLTAVSDEGDPMRTPDGVRATSVAVVGMDAAVDSAGDDELLPMASITKLITALVVLEEFPLEEGENGETITMTAQDLEYYWDVAAVLGVVTDLREGEELSQRTLLERSIAVSSGNATLSLVRWAFGGEEEFVTAAERWLEENDLDEIEIADSTGLSADSRATAADMARMGRLAYEHPVMRELMAVESVSVLGDTMRNTNPLLGDDGVVGGKTGTLFASGHNLLVVAEREVHGTEMAVVGVVLGVSQSGSVPRATTSWLDQSFNRFEERVVLPRGTVVGEYAPDWSDRTITASTTEELTAITWPGLDIPVSVLLDPVQAGSLSATPGNATVVSFDTAMSVDVAIDGLIPPPDALWRLGTPSLAVNWVLDLFGSE
ncbi:D-alanyl-D-alanine carboxypeptidase family protein [uncultured Agrococcus sp.]|uniref:D-alanyl-D-alanine carboxypeptidase family protein n=1 Tax=uncultured Agrococcus sp. TaxID=382258 RepID=UPI0025E31F59|nr:serine hydrolase [uncultured Agrococcus sp.]